MPPGRRRLPLGDDRGADALARAETLLAAAGEGPALAWSRVEPAGARRGPRTGAPASTRRPAGRRGCRCSTAAPGRAGAVGRRPARARRRPPPRAPARRRRRGGRVRLARRGAGRARSGASGSRPGRWGSPRRAPPSGTRWPRGRASGRCRPSRSWPEGARWWDWPRSAAARAPCSRPASRSRLDAEALAALLDLGPGGRRSPGRCGSGPPGSASSTRPRRPAEVVGAVEDALARLGERLGGDRDRTAAA